MFSTKIVFGFGFIIGLFLASLFIETNKVFEIQNYRKPKTINIAYDDSYEKWSKKSGYIGRNVSNDELYYGSKKYYLESDFLREKVPILCAVYVTKPRNAEACQETWLKHCNRHLFYSLPTVKLLQNSTISVFTLRVKSSWQLLCETILKINKNYKSYIKYVIFVTDAMFVIPENLRVKLAAFNADTDDIYIGHTVTFWGVSYNVIEAGFVLSIGVINKLAAAFESYGACENSGKYWKTEDWYLGKHLAELDVHPRNPNILHSSKNLSIFHGDSIERSMFPGSSAVLSRYYTGSTHPAACCSPETVTFYTGSADAMYHFEYFFYKLHIFRDGHLGNRPAPTQMTVEQIWRAAVREISPNLSKLDTISARQYIDMWKNKLMVDARHMNDEANLKYISNVGILNDILGSSGFVNKTKF